MLVGGLALAGYNTWQRLGRSSVARGWARGLRRSFTERSVLVLWPLLAVAMVLAGALGPLRGTGGEMVVGLLLLATLLLWLAYAVLPLPIPRFAQPRWYRSTRAAGRSGRG